MGLQDRIRCVFSLGLFLSGVLSGSAQVEAQDRETEAPGNQREESRIRMPKAEVEDIDAFLAKPGEEMGFQINELMKRYLETNGGRSAIESVGSIRIKGKLLSEAGTIPFTLIKKRPDRIHLTQDFGDYLMVTNYDGETVTRLVQQGDRTFLQEMEAAEQEAFIRDARFNSILVEYSEEYNRLTLSGTKEVNGFNCYEVEIDLPEGRVQVYLDDLRFRVQREIIERGDRVERTTYFGHEQHGSIWFAREILVENPGRSYRMEIEEVDLNIGIFDSFFSDLSAQP